jgi:putative transposase
VQEKKISHTKACKLLAISRNRYYQKRQPAKDAIIKEAIEAVLPGCKKGRNKVIRLVQKTNQFSASSIRRVYTKAGFSLFKKPAGRKIKAVANPLPVCLKPNEEWALDFMSDALTDGSRFRLLNAIDHYSRFCVLSRASKSFPARLLIEHLERAIQLYGKPERIRTDNGPEFISKRFQLWLKNNKIAWQQIQPGNPQQNACIERFNRTFREDILDANLFQSIEAANQVIEKTKTEYNEVRPHEAIKHLTPLELMAA